jgi:hypothetical protein
MGRYSGKTIGRNEERIYSDLLNDKGLNHIDHYLTPSYSPLEVDDTLSLTRIQHVWKAGDRLWKLSSQYYGEPTYWWLIAWYNQKPTESHFAIGDIVIIPTPFERVLGLYGNNS